jgi:hypothetical protein
MAGKPVQEVWRVLSVPWELKRQRVKSVEDLHSVSMEDKRAIKECGGHTFVTHGRRRTNTKESEDLAYRWNELCLKG